MLYMICGLQKKIFFWLFGILWFKFLSYIEVLCVLSEFSKLLELRFVSSSSETSRSSGTIQPSQSSISSHPVFPDVPCAYNMDDKINVPHPQLHQMMTGMMPSMTC